MTAPRRSDRLVDAFLADGCDELPDRAYDAVRAHIEGTRQRTVIGPRRARDMSIERRLIGAAAAVVAVVFSAANLPTTVSPGAGTATTSPPTPTANRTSSPALLTGVDYQAMAPGRYRMHGPSSNGGAGWPNPRLEATVPAGWTQNGQARGGGILRLNRAGRNEAAIVFGTVGHIPTDPCVDDVPPEPGTGSTIDDLVAAISAIPGVEATAVADVTLDGHAGKHIALMVPANRAVCESFVLWLTPSRGERWTVGSPPGWRHRIWIIDVAGMRFVITASTAPNAPHNVAAEIEQIVASVEFKDAAP